MSWLTRILAMPNDTPAKTLIVAFAVSLVCSVLVSSTAVTLRPIQRANKQRDQQAKVAEIVTLLPGADALLEGGGTTVVEAHVVELATGLHVDAIDPAHYDQRRAAADPEQSVAIPPEFDLARLERRARYATVFVLKEDDRIELVILPVHGKGYISTMYGFLALAGDLNTVVALSFFEHGETPGMGAVISDAAWQSQWTGKKVFDAEGTIRIGVARGPVDPAASSAAYEVDAISGATRTAHGVTNLLRFWLGGWGFERYLDRIRSR